MTSKKPRQFWIKITSFDKVEMGGFRYADAEISVDPDCAKNYADFRKSIHVIEFSALTKALSALEKCLPLLDAADGPPWLEAKAEVTEAIAELRGERG